MPQERFQLAPTAHLVLSHRRVAHNCDFIAMVLLLCNWHQIVTSLHISDEDWWISKFFNRKSISCNTIRILFSWNWWKRFDDNGLFSSRFCLPQLVVWFVHFTLKFTYFLCPCVSPSAIHCKQLLADFRNVHEWICMRSISNQTFLIASIVSLLWD